MGTVRLPCTPHMVQLGHRLATSSYDSVEDAIKGAFLSGNSLVERVTRNMAQGIHPGKKGDNGRPPSRQELRAASKARTGGRRLAEDGGFQASGTPNENFRRY